MYAVLPTFTELTLTFFMNNITKSWFGFANFCYMGFLNTQLWVLNRYGVASTHFCNFFGIHILGLFNCPDIFYLNYKGKLA